MTPAPGILPDEVKAMDAKGFIKISRQVLSLDIWHDPYDCRLYFFCLLRASHNYYGSLKPGQLFYSVQSLAASLNMSRNSIAKHIRILSEAGLITAQRTEEGSVITVLRWNEISGETVLKAADIPETPDAHLMNMNAQPLTENAQQMGMNAQPLTENAHLMGMDAQPLTKNAQPECMPCTTVEHYQKRYQEETRTLSQREREFEEWWKEYPRHERKSEAKNAWMKLHNVPAETLMRALRRAKQSSTWTVKNGRFIPSAVKWLDGNWEDFAEHEDEVITEWTEY